MLQTFSFPFLQAIKQVLSLTDGFFGCKELPWQDEKHGSPVLTKELSAEEARSAISTWIEAFDESYFEVDRLCDFNYTFEGVEHDIYVLDLHLSDGKVLMDAVAVSRESVFPWVHMDVSNLRFPALCELFEFLGVQVKIPMVSLSLHRPDIQSDKSNKWLVFNEDSMQQITDDLDKNRYEDEFLCCS